MRTRRPKAEFIRGKGASGDVTRGLLRRTSANSAIDGIGSMLPVICGITQTSRLPRSIHGSTSTNLDYAGYVWASTDRKVAPMKASDECSMLELAVLGSSSSKETVAYFRKVLMI